MPRISALCSRTAAMKVGREVVAICAERVGLDQIRPGAEVAAMHFGHHGRIGEIKRVEAGFKTHPVGMQLGAHRAIGEQGRRF